MGIKPRDYEAKIRGILVARLAVAGAYATAELKLVLSVPSPNPPGLRGGPHYVRAIPGAPPRKVTGKLRASVTFLVDERKLTCRVGTNVKYGRFLELGTPYYHPWLMKTLKRMQNPILKILSRPIP